MSKYRLVNRLTSTIIVVVVATMLIAYSWGVTDLTSANELATALSSGSETVGRVLMALLWATLVAGLTAAMQAWLAADRALFGRPVVGEVRASVEEQLGRARHILTEARYRTQKTLAGPEPASAQPEEVAAAVLRQTREGQQAALPTGGVLATVVEGLPGRALLDWDVLARHVSDATDRALQKIEPYRHGLQLAITIAPALGFLATLIGMIFAFQKLFGDSATRLSPEQFSALAHSLRLAIVSSAVGIGIKILLAILHNMLAQSFERRLAQFGDLLNDLRPIYQRSDHRVPK